MLFSFYVIVVISRPPVVRSVSYSASPSSLEQPSEGSMSPACKAASGLDPNLGNVKSNGIHLWLVHGEFVLGRFLLK